MEIGFKEALSASSSGMAIRVRSSRASKEPDSSTSPGMSALVAIQTQASSSQVILMIYSILNTSWIYYMFWLMLLSVYLWIVSSAEQVVYGAAEVVGNFVYPSPCIGGSGREQGNLSG